jgi:peptidoglycan/xylan/chitin deacetylase (PgdA/CDA1 family)
VRIDGRGFPEKVVALTWDDGPDVHTVELARFLREQKVAATFFVVGEWIDKVSSDPGDGKGVFETGHVKMPVLGELVALGHRLGNHTMHHVLLGEADGPTVVRELARNQAAIDPFLTNELRIFRAPGGSWSDAAARAVDAAPELASAVGPLHWDLDRKDWEGSLYCRGSESAADCEAAAPGGARRVRASVIAKRYLDTITSAGHGVVLLHDRVGHVGSRYALDVARELVPALVARGFVFAPPVLRFGPLERRTTERFGGDLAVLDVNGDGRGDLCDASGCALARLEGSPPRVAFGPKAPHPRAREAKATHAADLNGDGRPDACTASAEGIDCALAPATPTRWLSGATPSAWTLGDVNGDGRADFCATAADGVLCGLAP